MLYVYGFLLSLMVGYPAYKKNALTLSGLIAAVVLGTLLFGFGDAAIYMSLIAFFISSSFLSKLSKVLGGKETEQIEKRLEKTGRRDHTQALANSGVALLCSILFQISGMAIFKLGAVIAFAAANADTWASEIGVLSKEKPVNILSKTPVIKGLSGGVTRLGFLASFSGAAFIAVVYILFSVWTLTLTEVLLHLSLITLFGFLGSIVDSILGEKLQAKYLDLQTNELTEKAKQTGHKLVSGVRIVDNNVVNFLSGFISAVLGMLMLNFVK